MTVQKFEDIVSSQLQYCSDLLLQKGKEYAPDAVTTRPTEDVHADRLAHFKKAAAITGTTPRMALLGMFAKHIVSISDMCAGNAKYSRDKWTEKITDSINYLLLLRAVVEEEEENE